MLITSTSPTSPPHPARPPSTPPRRRPLTANQTRTRRDLLGAAVSLSLVAVLALWVSHRGLQDLGGGTGSALTSLGRLTGLEASNLLLLQVLGMARIPVVERAYGQDRLARWHRWVGFGSFNLMLAHIVLVTVGYAVSGRTDVPSQAWDLVWNYPGMLLATAGSVLLVVVVALSIKAARRRLRYESWHLIHLYAYLGVGLALPHQLWTGTDFVASPAARLYWWSLYVATLTAVLSCRVGLPLWRSWRHRLEVEAVVQEAPGVVSVHLQGRALDRLPVQAGQFFVWRFLDGAGWSRGHPFSLSAAPHPTMMRVTVKDLGDGSRDIAALRPGTRAIIEGPYGRLTGDVRTRRKMTMIAAGIGVTPMRALLEELPYAPGEAVLIVRAAGPKHVVFRSELDALAAGRGARIVYLLGRRARRPSWLPQNLAHRRDDRALREIVPDIAEHDVFVCGPDSWMDSVRDAALLAGVPPAQVHIERFTW